MHKLAVAFFYACALLSLSVTALVFIGKASAQHGGHVSGYERAARAHQCIDYGVGHVR